jgi:hypothetical protein
LVFPLQVVAMRGPPERAHVAGHGGGVVSKIPSHQHTGAMNALHVRASCPTLLTGIMLIHNNSRHLRVLVQFRPSSVFPLN